MAVYFVIRISRRNGLKDYLKSRINKLPKKKITINFLLVNADLLKISVFYLY